MKLCGIIDNGRIFCVTPVNDDHVFGNRDTYAHMEVKLLDWDEVPEKYKGKKKVMKK